MGILRFKEWLAEEGSPGSLELLRLYEDVNVYKGLLAEVQVRRV